MTDTARTTDEMVAAIDLFAGLSGRQRKRLISLAKEVDFPAGHVVADQGADAMAFHLVLSGEASVSRTDGEVRRLQPGEYFGEISMIDGKPRSATVTAATPLRTLVVQNLVFQDLLDDDPKFARGLLDTLCARLREAEARS